MESNFPIVNLVSPSNAKENESLLRTQKMKDNTIESRNLKEISDHQSFLSQNTYKTQT